MKAWKNKILAGIAICFLLTLFPPFVGGKTDSEDKFIGFHFLLGTPKFKSPRPQTSNTYKTINGERKIISQKIYYPRLEYLHSRIDPLRYMFLIILIALGVTSWGLLKNQPNKGELNVEHV